MSKTKLSRERKALLKTISEFDKASCKNLYENKDWNGIYSSKNSLSNAIRQLETETELIDFEKNGRTKLYHLTEKGQNRLRKIRERERQRLENKENTLDEELAREEFLRFFEEDEEGQKQVNKTQRTGRDFIELDVSRFAKVGDPGIADKIQTMPEKTIKAFDKALRDLEGVDQDIDIRFKNIPDFDTVEISSVSARNKNELIQVQGVIKSVSNTKLSLISGKFECENCGSRYEKEQDGSKLKSPYKCQDCGSKKFSVLEEVMETVRVVRIKESADKQDPKEMVVYVSGSLAEDESKSLKAIGSSVKVIGHIEPYKKKKNADLLDYRLKANNLEVQEDKWEDIEITEEDLEELQDLAERDDVVDLLIQSYGAEEIRGLSLLKKSAYVWLLGKTEHSNIHVLVFGEPGTGKSLVSKWALDNFPRIVKSVGTGSTGVGLTASVTKDKVTGKWVAEGGDIPKADGGFHITDEADKLEDEDIIKFNQALEDQEISISKANISTTLSSDVSEFSIANPEGNSFFDGDDLYKQIPIPDDKAELKDRYDIILSTQRDRIGENSSDRDKQLHREKAKTQIMSRTDNLEEDVSEFQDIDYEEDELLDIETLRKYVAYAQSIEPEISEEMVEKMVDLHMKLKEAGGEAQNYWDLRRNDALRKLCIAFARMNLDQKVTEKHLAQASEYLRETLESLEFDIGEDTWDDFSSRSGRRFERVENAMKQLREESEDRSVEKQDLVDELDMKESDIEEIIGKMKRKGRIYDVGATNRLKIKTQMI